jgi:hypothetical protein
VFAATYGTGVFIGRNNAAWSACTAQPASPNVLTLAMQANGKLYAGTEAGCLSAPTTARVELR